MSEDLPAVDDLEPEVPEVIEEDYDAPEEEPDEPDLQDDGSDEQNESVEAAPQAEKQQGRLAKLARERKDANERAKLSEERSKLLELQMQQMMQQRMQPPAPEENLDPDEKWRRQANETIQRTQFQTMDMVDKNSYQVKAINSPVYRRWEAKVESELAKARANGNNPTRENILKFLLGESVLSNKGASKPVVRSKTPARQAAEKVTTPGGRSSVSPSKTTPSLKDKLKDVRL